MFPIVNWFFHKILEGNFSLEHACDTKHLFDLPIYGVHGLSGVIRSARGKCEQTKQTTQRRQQTVTDLDIRICLWPTHLFHLPDWGNEVSQVQWASPLQLE